jgi:hypothetical protein
MGWCVECHRAATDNNLASLSWIDAPAPKLDERVHLAHGHALPKAPLDCVACHH